MEKFTQLDGLVAPLDRANVDTDAIIPKQFLKSIKRTGFGPNLFDEWRYLDHGEPGMDNSKRPLNPDFVLNQPRYQGAQMLLARENFGCGSVARACAVGAAGLRLPRHHRAQLRRHLLQQLFQERPAADRAGCAQRSIACSSEAEARRGYRLTVDLEQQTVTTPDGHGIQFRGRRIPQALPAERPGRYRPDPAARGQDQGVRRAAQGRSAVAVCHEHEREA